MKRIFLTVWVFLWVGNLAVMPAWPEEKDRSSQKEMGGMGGMMDNSMMSSHNDMMGKMLDTMKEMAQVLKEQAKDPDVKAKTDRMMVHIEQMKNQHQKMSGMMSKQGK